MQQEIDNSEALREALLNLDRIREQEKTARLQMETLIDGLQVLNECQSVTKLYKEILDCLQGLIGFDCAAILIESSNGFLSTAVSTDERLRFQRVDINGVFERSLAGRATILTNLDKVPNWPEPAVASGAAMSPPENAKKLKSALLVVLPASEKRMLLVCASENLSALKRNELQLLESFTPLATQAVCRAMEMERLSYLVTTLDHQAHFDMLTGLPNRTLLEQKLISANEHNQKMSLLFLDLDNFKSINDTFGHAIGDVLLSEVAFRMSAVVGLEDTVARMGGDEFALIVQSSKSRQEVENLCRDILAAIRKPLYIRNGRVVPSASIGVLFEIDTQLPSQLQMQKADIAMYSAKQKGRNQYCFFNDEMAAMVQTEFEIESNLPLAIKNQDFHLVYQPIVSATTLECRKIEVLVRWGRESEASYHPYQFIPLAEKTGAIIELGEWIATQALAEFSPWLHQNESNVLAINISQVQLQRANFSTEFIGLVSNAGIQFSQIELELSENIIADSIDSTVLENIQCLDDVGIQFAFDDFGTGSSSLLHLQKFSGTSLKIDKSFIDQIETDSEHRQLVAGMIDFGHHLKMNIVAEGVETTEQMDILIQFGVDSLQGYLFARPADVKSTLALLDQWTQHNLPAFPKAA